MQCNTKVFHLCIFSYDGIDRLRFTGQDYQVQSQLAAASTPKIDLFCDVMIISQETGFVKSRHLPLIFEKYGSIMKKGGGRIGVVCPGDSLGIPRFFRGYPLRTTLPSPIPAGTKRQTPRPYPQILHNRPKKSVMRVHHRLSILFCFLCGEEFCRAEQGLYICQVEQRHRIFGATLQRTDGEA